MAENKKIADALSSNIGQTEGNIAASFTDPISSINVDIPGKGLTPEQIKYNEEALAGWLQRDAAYQKRLVEYNNALSSGRSEYTVTDHTLSPYQQGMRSQMGVDPATDKPQFTNFGSNEYAVPNYRTEVVKVADMKAPIKEEKPFLYTPEKGGNLGISTRKSDDGAGSSKETWARIGFTPLWDIENKETSKVTTDIYGMKDDFENVGQLQKSLQRVGRQDHIMKKKGQFDGYIQLLDRNGNVADKNVTMDDFIVRALDRMDNAYWDMINTIPTKDGKPRAAKDQNGKYAIAEFSKQEIADMREKGGQSKRDADILTLYYKLVGGQARSNGLINLSRVSDKKDTTNQSLGVAVSLGDAFSGNSVAGGFPVASLFQVQGKINSTGVQGENRKSATFSLHPKTSELADTLSELSALYMGNEDELAEKNIVDMYGEGDTVKQVPLSQKKSLMNRFLGINGVNLFYDEYQLQDMGALAATMAKTGALQPGVTVNMFGAKDGRILNTMASNGLIDLSEYKVKTDNTQMLNSGSQPEMPFQSYLNLVLQQSGTGVSNVLEKDAEMPIQYNAWSKATNYVPDKYNVTSIVPNTAFPTMAAQKHSYFNKLTARQ